MKRLAVLALCLCLFPYCTMTAFSEETTLTASADGAVISVSVPNAHTLTVTAPDGVTVSLDGVSGNNFSVERLSEPTIEIKTPDGMEIVKVTLNGEDITDKLVNGEYTLPPVYEDLALEVETKATGTAPAEQTTESTTEPTESSTTNSETSSTASSETESSSSKTDSSSNNTAANSNGGGTSNSENKTYPETDSPKTGDTAAVGSITLAILIGLAMIFVTMKRRDKDE